MAVERDQEEHKIGTEITATVRTKKRLLVKCCVLRNPHNNGSKSSSKQKTNPTNVSRLFLHQIVVEQGLSLNVWILVFRNSSFLLLNGYSIYWLCLTFWTNEFLGSYSNYKFIISFSIFNRMGLWRTLCLQSIIEEVLSLSFSIPISSLWFYNSSSFLSSFSFFCCIFYLHLLFYYLMLSA